jgi:hypothetical protein
MFGTSRITAQTSPMTSSPLFSARQNVIVCPRFDRIDREKLNERSGNVIENKGLLWKTGQQSRNVYENKGT